MLYATPLEAIGCTLSGFGEVRIHLIIDFSFKKKI